jgi:DNA modification methylase
MSQENLDLTSSQASGPVECLGQTFPSNEARREHYTELLREKLNDPEFRKIEGFPIGEAEDILNLSDPPYYTACPNPWIGEFIEHHGRPYDPKEKYHREPYAADVSEGKGHAIYNAHSYHTKVPHRAIMRYILHYTEPGDIVFDGFCGTGMTGIAAQLCGDINEIREMGYRVDSDGTIFDTDGIAFSKLGARNAILNDLSPVASFIAKNYNTLVDPDKFQTSAKRIIAEVDQEFGWMYKTVHSDGKSEGPIKLTIWSDILLCPECSAEFAFWDAAANSEVGKIVEPFACPSCAISLKKKDCIKATNSKYDSVLKKTINQRKRKPIEIVYTIGNKRYRKKPDASDLSRLDKIDSLEVTSWFPFERMMNGGETRRNDKDGITHVHHFYSKRNLIVLAAIRARVFELKQDMPALGQWFTSSHPWTTQMTRLLVSNYFNKKGGIVAPTLQGTLYISSLSAETNAIDRFSLRIKSTPHTGSGGKVAINCGSTAEIPIPDSSIDYLFLDPPFGANIAYSELNFLWESWLAVKTAFTAEAIENKPHQKTLGDYHELMKKCFDECYRILKPGRWVTIEFSNTKAAVWNSIQTALNDSGLIVASTAILEKEHKGFRAVTTATAVKQDLAITAYKPSSSIEVKFNQTETPTENAWEFVRMHLEHLTIVKAIGGIIAPIQERDPRSLYDRMVAFYVSHNKPVPYSSAEFQAKLAEKFPERDGMIFLHEQVTEYDKKAAQMESLGQMSIFVEDEKSAINWLRNHLKDKPATYQDIQPKFMEQLSASWKKFESRPELSSLLQQNFIKYDGTGEVPSQIHGYLSTNFKNLRGKEKDDASLQAKAKDRWYVPDPKKAVDVEAVRNKRLLIEFWSYLPAGYTPPQSADGKQIIIPGLEDKPKAKGKAKKLKEVRTEAVRVGFAHCFKQQDYATILAVAEQLPTNVVEEDEQLQMIYDVAEMRSD